MSDQAHAEAEFLQDLQAFVSEKWQRRPCDRCGTFNWSILPGNANVLGLRAQTPHEFSDLPSVSSYTVEFLPVYCDNCGNTVSIFKRVFDEWRKARTKTT
jgi:hypothetical protein